MGTQTIEILLATYNSERFLRELLDSLIAQTIQDFHILIGDDGSTDATLEIIEEVRRSHPDKIRLLPPHGNRGFLANFGALLQAASANVIFFCDHDDVWMPDKIAKTMKRMREMTDRFGKDVPLCVHCDAFLCDDALNVIHPSRHAAWKMGRSPEECGRPVDITIFGCSMAINRRLRDLALPLTPACASHDTWCGRIAWYLGKVSFIDESLVKYRVHTDNLSCNSSKRYPQVLFRHFRKFRASRHKLNDNLVAPSAEFARRYAEQLSAGDRKRLEIFGRWNEFGIMRRIYLMLRYKLYANGMSRTIGLIVL